MTEWRKIPSYPDYEVSLDGQVRRLTTHVLASRWNVGRVLGHSVNHAGYFRVGLKDSAGHRKSCRVARLVTEAFIGKCPDGYEVNHKNGVKSDNRLVNLEYVTRSGNVRHAFDTGLLVRAKGEHSSNAKLTDRQADDIRLRYRRYDRAASANVLAREYGVHSTAIIDIVAGRTYLATERTET